MPDRRRRTDLLLPRERQSTDDSNPFAPPPDGTPDQPWAPRRPRGSSGPDGSGSNGSGSGDSGGSPGDGSSSDDRPRWGSQWSSRQPGRSSGDGFGGRQNGQNNQNNGRQDPGGGLRWDPTDPAQRRARYALLGGMWAFFFALFEFRELALLLGALSLYWGISSLRSLAKQPAQAPAAPAHEPPGSGALRSQRTSAVTGVVMAGIALMIVASYFASELVYRDFYVCKRDALTTSGQLACNDKLPEPLRGIIGVQE
jgi:hypothetical protein